MGHHGDGDGITFSGAADQDGRDAIGQDEEDPGEDTAHVTEHEAQQDKAQQEASHRVPCTETKEHLRCSAKNTFAKALL